MSSGGISPQQHQLTSVVYGAIRDERYEEAVGLLKVQLQTFPRSRAALSLLGYCLYQTGDFRGAAATYDDLCGVCPEEQEYKLYHAQALYKAGAFAEASKAALRIFFFSGDAATATGDVGDATTRGGHHAQQQQRNNNDDDLRQRVAALRAAIAYGQDQLGTAKAHLDDECLLRDDPDVLTSYAAIATKENRFEDARSLYEAASQTLGVFRADIAVNLALCDYKEGKFASALTQLAAVIERGVRDHPELSVGSTTDGVEVRSVGNSQILQETHLVEAFNLKFAVEYRLCKNVQAAKEALSDMPPRAEEELDAVSLHNAALVDDDPSAAFRKLNFLLSHPPFPPEAYGNLLLFHCKFGYNELAADMIAENGHLTYTFLSADLLEFLEATTIVRTSPQVAFQKYDDLASKHVDKLRKLTKAIQDARVKRGRGEDSSASSSVKTALKDYDEAVEAYMPVLMAQAKIYWELGNYGAVEKLFRQSAEFCSENDSWKLNVAHVFFMQEKFKDAIRYYDAYKKNTSSSRSLLEVPAIVLANLCVSYIMTSQNEDAEELMRAIEKEEEKAAYTTSTSTASSTTSAETNSNNLRSQQQSYHLCIVNLVIGTLYCAKGNFEFGISRVIKSLEPLEKKLGADTWYYAKRCFLAAAEMVSKHMLILKDSSVDDILAFLNECETHGAKVLTVITPTVDPDGKHPAKPPATVTQDARNLKLIFLKIRDSF